MNRNLILSTDSYKSSHFLCYPPGTTKLFSYLESRGGRYDHTVFFGLQYILQEYLANPVTMQDVEEAKEFFAAHGEPFPYDGWRRIVEVHGGKVPVRIKAVPEGSVIPTHNVLMTVENTDPQLPWVVSWIETLLMRVWYPITVCTTSFYAKKVIWEFLNRTSDDPDAEISFKLHDFGARGVSSGESAAIGGAAHLVNFMGSDTVEGVVLANRYYHEKMAGFSIPAAEHSTITSWGKAGECDAYRNMLTQFAKPGSLVAIVSDSYDLWNAIDKIWGGELRQQVIDSGATVVIRPDSGEPRDVVRKALEMLDAKFGSRLNSKGYKVLNNVRVIQGDGIDRDSIGEILRYAAVGGYSASNIAFGMGGGLLQQCNRDTLRFAYKCSAAEIDGEWRPVCKNPVTDPGKASKAGRLMLYCEEGKYKTSVEGNGLRNDWALDTVYDDGTLFPSSVFFVIRNRANLGLTKLVSKV